MMRSLRFAVAVLTLGTSLCHAQDETPTTKSLQVLDIYILAGQSNAVGADADVALLPDDPRDQQVWFWWKCGDPPADQHDSSSDNQWTTLQAQPKGDPITPRNNATRQYGNFLVGDGGFGPEMGLARTLLTSRELRTTTPNPQSPAFAILKVAYSGTSVENDWNPDAVDEKGNCLGELIDQFNLAAQAATQQGYRLKPAAFIWVQGESDSYGSRLTHYQERLTRTLQAVRASVQTPDLEIRLAVNTRFQPQNPEQMVPVVAIHRAIAEDDAHCQYVDTSSATIANGAHFDSQGTLDVGKMIAESLLVPATTAEPPPLR